MSLISSKSVRFAAVGVVLISAAGIVALETRGGAQAPLGNIPPQVRIVDAFETPSVMAALQDTYETHVAACMRSKGFSYEQKTFLGARTGPPPMPKDVTKEEADQQVRFAEALYGNGAVTQGTPLSGLPGSCRRGALKQMYGTETDRLFAVLSEYTDAVRSKFTPHAKAKLARDIDQANPGLLNRVRAAVSAKG